MFLGGNYTDAEGFHSITGIIGDPVFMAILLFLFMFILTAVLGLGFMVGSVIIIPSAFIVLQWIPELRVILAIILGGVLGIALNKFMSRR